MRIPKKIVGYNLGKSLETSETIQALEMAILSISNERKELELIHHSDRGNPIL